MNALLQREGELTRFLLVVAGGALPVILTFEPVDRITLLAGSSLLLVSIAWVVNLQYWNTLWYEYYILTVLRPAAERLTGDATTWSYESFTRSIKGKPRALLGLVAVGSTLFQVVILSPSIVYWGAALFVSDDLGVQILPGQWFLLGTSGVLMAGLVASTCLAYRARLQAK